VLLRDARFTTFPAKAEVAQVRHDDVTEHGLEPEGGEQAVEGAMSCRLVEPVERSTKLSRKLTKTRRAAS
jgi:hypothetical protein